MKTKRKIHIPNKYWTEAGRPITEISAAERRLKLPGRRIIRKVLVDYSRYNPRDCKRLGKR